MFFFCLDHVLTKKWSITCGRTVTKFETKDHEVTVECKWREGEVYYSREDLIEMMQLIRREEKKMGWKVPGAEEFNLSEDELEHVIDRLDDTGGYLIKGGELKYWIEYYVNRDRGLI